MLTWLSKKTIWFPPLKTALREPNGLLAVGGDLSPKRLIAAYRHGCFPWYEEGQPILWWSPAPRAVLFPAELHVSHSLAKTMRKQPFRISLDEDFAGVIQSCAGRRNGVPGTWITPAMQKAYIELHRQGVAHSVEAWQGNRLVGGLYGLAIGRIFFGESMFSRVDDASKIGFVTLVQRLQDWQFTLIDCQMASGHLQRFGARTISREDFVGHLKQGLDEPSLATWQL